MKRIIIVILLVFSTSVFGATRGKSDLAHIKMGDTTSARYFNNKIKDKRPIVNIDSNFVYLSGWADSLGNPEVSMQVGLIHELMPFADTFLVDSMNGDVRVRMGRAGIFTYDCFVREDGAFEWNAVLHQKLGGNRNYVTFPFETDGLTFYYQDTLMDWEKAEGDIRPDSVVGSYAIYHSTKKNSSFNQSTGMEENYMVGKFGHLYRPKAWDANGDTVWIEMFVDTVNQTMTLTADKTWLRNAVYPVTFDPTFGNTSTGDSIKEFLNWTRGSKFTFGASDATGITAGYAYSVNSGDDVWMSILGNVDVGTNEYAILDTTKTYAVSIDSLSGWTTWQADSGFTENWLPLADSVYWLVVTPQTSGINFTCKFDAGGTNTGMWAEYNTFPGNTGVLADGEIGWNSVSGTRIYSMYLEYTVSGAAPDPQVIIIGQNDNPIEQLRKAMIYQNDKKTYDSFFYADKYEWDYPSTFIEKPKSIDLSSLKELFKTEAVR